MYICKYCGREFDTKQKLAGHVTHCDKNPNYDSDKSYEQLKNARANNKPRKQTEEEKIECPYCGKKFSKYGLKHHMVLCDKNPNRDESKINPICLKGHKSWSKGLTKNTDERLMKMSNTTKERYKNGELHVWSEGLTKDTDERVKHQSDTMSNIMKQKIKDGVWVDNCSKIHKIYYDNEEFDSSWECEFYKFLKEHNVEIQRCKQWFEYVDSKGKTRLYFPDFYLKEFDLYIEIKAFSKEKDKLKWEQFPNDKRLEIYFGNDLVLLGLNGIQKVSDKRDEKQRYFVPDKYKNQKFTKLF